MLKFYYEQVHGPITSMSAMDEKSINNEETAAAET